MKNLNLSNIWNKIITYLQKEVDEHNFATWIKTTQPLAFHDGTIIIGTCNDFTRDWLDSRYGSLICSFLEKEIGFPIFLKFIVLDQNQQLKTYNVNEFLNINYNSQLNNKYTFNTFVVGNSNRLAHAAALAVAESPSKAYNPFFIYGGVGLGKTHLMHAIGHHVLQHQKTARILYVTSEAFTNELINSIRDDKTKEFRDKYRTIDVLLVDDIQFLAGKERTQEEFFHTFNSLHEADKQIVISSDRPPKEIPTLEDRLRSRFEWGLITDIQPPDLETRVAILRKKAQLENYSIPDDVINFIALKVKSNIRELEGILLRVIAYASIQKKDIDLNTATEAVKNIIDENKPIKVTIPHIQKKVAQYFEIKIDDFKAKKRTKDIVYPRQIAMYLSRELTDSSLPKIGQEFGGRDHTTVIHAYEKIKKQLKKNNELKETIQKITKMLQTN